MGIIEMKQAPWFILRIGITLLGCSAVKVILEKQESHTISYSSIVWIAGIIVLVSNLWRW